MPNLSPPKPDWLKVRLPRSNRYNHVRDVIAKHRLNTVCASAMCPNALECWDEGCLTFMVMGNTCTRSCRFCGVAHGAVGEPLDITEPERLVSAARTLGLSYVVITSVDRDDLPDFGAGHYAACIEALNAKLPGVRVEAIIPDFSGRLDLLEQVVDARPDVISHNIETVERLSSTVRDRRAGYYRSLDVLRDVKRLNPRLITKSSLLLGMGEEDAEIRQSLHHLHEARVDVLAIGQYLRPGHSQLPVSRYVKPEMFEELAAYGRSLGFRQVSAGPFVRTSYHAGQQFEAMAADSRGA